MRIGILGGTFDPPHTGHLSLGLAAIEQLELDELLFIPANRNPIKSVRTGTPAKHRIAMVERLIKDQPKMAYSDMEITRGGPSYTVDTVTEMQMVSPGEYWFIMGADALRGLPNWKSPARLMRLCRLGVAVRPPLIVSDVLVKLPEEFKGKVDVISMPALDISSSELRTRLQKHQVTTPWITPEVHQYIESNKLYRNE
jgi:nicotinate-nucleotide adenylyltransferase